MSKLAGLEVAASISIASDNGGCLVLWKDSTAVRIFASTIVGVVFS